MPDGPYPFRAEMGAQAASGTAQWLIIERSMAIHKSPLDALYVGSTMARVHPLLVKFSQPAYLRFMCSTFEFCIPTMGAQVRPGRSGSTR